VPGARPQAERSPARASARERRGEACRRQADAASRHARLCREASAARRAAGSARSRAAATRSEPKASEGKGGRTCAAFSRASPVQARPGPPARGVGRATLAPCGFAGSIARKAASRLPLQAASLRARHAARADGRGGEASAAGLSRPCRRHGSMSTELVNRTCQPRVTKCATRRATYSVDILPPAGLAGGWPCLWPQAGHKQGQRLAASLAMP
jgi:hypothetical protein